MISPSGFRRIYQFAVVFLVLCVFIVFPFNSLETIDDAKFGDEMNPSPRVLALLEEVDMGVWDRPIEILDRRPSDVDRKADLGTWLTIAKKLGPMNRTGELSYLNDILVEYAPDWSNGTAYIAMTDISPEYTEPLLEQFSEHQRKYIRFIKASAARPVVNMWQEKVWSKHKELEYAGVMVWTASYYFDGRLLLGVEDVDQGKADIMARILDDVPTGILVLVNASPIVPC